MSEQGASQLDDAALMAGAARGDIAAFEQLVERHQALVIGTVGRMLGNNSDVEDVAQQVFVRVWKSAGALPADREIHHLAANHHTQSRF